MMKRGQIRVINISVEIQTSTSSRIVCVIVIHRTTVRSVRVKSPTRTQVKTIRSSVETKRRRTQTVSALKRDDLDRAT